MREDLMENEQVPDATTFCKLINERGIAELFFESMKEFLERHGQLMQPKRSGSSVKYRFKT